MFQEINTWYINTLKLTQRTNLLVMISGRQTNKLIQLTWEETEMGTLKK